MPAASQPSALPLDPVGARPSARAAASRARTTGALSPATWAVFAVAIIASMATSNPVLTPAAIAVLAVLVRLLRRRGETPVLLFAMGMQWVQVSAKVFEADYFGVPVDQIGHSVMITTAVWLGLAALTVVAIGMHVALRSLRIPALKRIDEELRSLSMDRLFGLYLLLLVLALGSERLIWALLPIAEALRALGDLRWAFYFLLGFNALRRRQRMAYFLVATAIELVVGIGYFSSFRTVLFMAIIVAIASGRRMNLRSLTATTIAATATIVFALAWQSVKGEYRNYLNQGTHQQVALVSTEDQLQTFGTLIAGLDSRDLQGSLPALIDRLSYVDFFADVLDHVPAQLPHEGGSLLWKAIVHVLTPRILFPNKPILPSDSEETMYYTGRVLASDAQGTSISIGYVAEQYIDFGRWGMFVPIFLIGLAWGGMYRYCLTRRQPIAFDIAFASALMIFVNQFEMQEIKLIGGTLMRFLVFALFMRFALPSLTAWLLPSRQPARPAR